LHHHQISLSILAMILIVPFSHSLICDAGTYVTANEDYKMTNV